MSHIRHYYQLTKPGIIRGNALTALAGFFLASGVAVNYILLIQTILGLSLVIASACTINNYLDRGIDKKMARTKNRALVTGTISNFNALLFATALGVSGFGLLLLTTNVKTTVAALVGFIVYVVIYGILKRRSVYGTIVGSISGAVPPVVGYLAVSNSLDSAAIILFLILVFWQMPHFYAIAMYRLQDYSSASIPVLPVIKGMRITKIQVLLYIVGFIFASASLTLLGHTGIFYLIVMVALGLAWFIKGIRGFTDKSDTEWGKHMFLFSLIVITGWCIAIVIDNFLV